MEGFAAHPALRLTEVGTPGGAVELPAEPVRWGPGRSDKARPVPELDEHGPAIRREFGRDTE
jgi:crotonobetainyl-CoA:carnitine CoA-transferase CaiB-like acyl-CoA transferase